MSDDIQAEILTMHKEFEWLMKEEVNNVLKELHGLLLDACKRFSISLNPGEENLAKSEKFVLNCLNGSQQVKCMVTLRRDCICEADLTLKIYKQQAVPFLTKISPDFPWRIQQIQDAGNFILKALEHVQRRDEDYRFKSAQEIIMLLDNIIDCLIRGRTSLALPKRKTLDELAKNPVLKAFKPPLPQETVVSFYIQAQKVVLAIYQLYFSSPTKYDISSRYQLECFVPWLNDILVLFTVALQQCQQLRGKIRAFLPYQDKFPTDAVPPSSTHIFENIPQVQVSHGSTGQFVESKTDKIVTAPAGVPIDLRQNNRVACPVPSSTVQN